LLLREPFGAHEMRILLELHSLHLLPLHKLWLMVLTAGVT